MNIIFEKPILNDLRFSAHTGQGRGIESNIPRCGKMGRGEGRGRGDGKEGSNKFHGNKVDSNKERKKL